MRLCGTCPPRGKMRDTADAETLLPVTAMLLSFSKDSVLHAKLPLSFCAKNRYLCGTCKNRFKLNH